MRRSSLLVAAGLAVASVLGISSANGQTEATSQSAATTANFAEPAANIRGNVRPRRLPPRRFRNVRGFIQVWHDNADPSETGVPKPTLRVLVDFPRNIRVNTDALPRCRANIEGTSTRQARQRCGRALFGTGRAEAKLPGPGGTIFEVNDLVVSAFNGSNLRGENRIRLHADSAGTLPPGQAAQVIQGRLVNAPGRPFGRRLIAEVPPIVGGEGANTLFNVTIRRSTGFAQARCATRVMRFRARYFFRDSTSLPFVSNSQRCRRR
jgi:hypothetical protein